MHGSHNREVSGALRAVMVPVVACGGPVSAMALYLVTG